MKQYLEQLKKEFGGHTDFSEKRPGIYQLRVPFYYEDGDMMDIFLTTIKGEPCISDFGLTLMRLSYTYNIDTPNKDRIFHRILLENGLHENNGNIFAPIISNSIMKTLMHFAMVISKVMSMQYWSRNVVESLFLENLEEYVDEYLSEFLPERNVMPLSNRDDLTVDYAFNFGKRPIYLFPIQSHDKVMLTSVAILEFHKAGLPFLGFALAENYSHLSSGDQKKVMSVSDSIFYDFDQFKKDAPERLRRYSSVN